LIRLSLTLRGSEEEKITPWNKELITGISHCEAQLTLMLTGVPWPRLPVVGDYIEIGKSELEVSQVNLNLDGSVHIFIDYNLYYEDTDASKSSVYILLERAINEGFILESHFGLNL
jgi:hypothetical protein